MAKIIKDKKEVEIKDGEEIKVACESLGVHFGCRHGACGTCEIEIISGYENLSELSDAELLMNLPKNHRLACQCKIKKGNIEIKTDY